MSDIKAIIFNTQLDLKFSVWTLIPHSLIYRKSGRLFCINRGRSFLDKLFKSIYCGDYRNKLQLI